jgi:hypothetical protein
VPLVLVASSRIERLVVREILGSSLNWRVNGRSITWFVETLSKSLLAGTTSKSK